MARKVTQPTRTSRTRRRDRRGHRALRHPAQPLPPLTDTPLTDAPPATAAVNQRERSSGERLAQWATRLRFDEPVFTLRARDLTAPNAVRRWAAAAASCDAPAMKIGDAMLTAERMERWQRLHGCKAPD